MVSKSYETIALSNDGGVTTVMLNRPEARNAMSPTLHREMRDALIALEHDDDTRVVVITGAGNSFSAGQDLRRYFYENRDDPSAHARDREVSHEWRHRILNYYPKPTIASVNGYCFGGAFTILASCDVVVAADEAVFGLSEVNWGSIPGGLVAKVVADMMAPKQALYYAMTGQRFDGRKAAEIGLATMSVPLAELPKVTSEVANVLKEKDALTLRAIKVAMKGVDLRSTPFEDAHRWLSSVSDQLKAWHSRAGLEGGFGGIRKFLDKQYRPGMETMPTEASSGA